MPNSFRFRIRHRQITSSEYFASKSLNERETVFVIEMETRCGIFRRLKWVKVAKLPYNSYGGGVFKTLEDAERSLGVHMENIKSGREIDVVGVFTLTLD